jgi:shikimate kinase
MTTTRVNIVFGEGIAWSPLFLRKRFRLLDDHVGDTNSIAVFLDLVSQATSLAVQSLAVAHKVERPLAPGTDQFLKKFRIQRHQYLLSCQFAIFIFINDNLTKRGYFFKKRLFAFSTPAFSAKIFQEMNLILIGYRGTGKTTVGRILAERLGLRLVSLDALIIEKAGASIPEIVDQYGWDHFRDLESEVVKETCRSGGQVLDCGGGVILRDENVRELKGAGVVIWLRAGVKTIVERIHDDDQRPSLTGKKSFLEEVEEVLFEREPGYQAAADIIVDTEGKTPEALAGEITALIREEAPAPG